MVRHANFSASADGLGICSFVVNGTPRCSEPRITPRVKQLKSTEDQLV